MQREAGNRTFITTSSVEKLLDQAIAAGAQASDDSVDLGKAKALPVCGQHRQRDQGHQWKASTSSVPGWTS